MPRPGSKIEKSKDFKGSMKKIIKSLTPWHTLIVVAVVLASVSAIIYLISPNKLSSLTDYITEGLKPNLSEKSISNIMSDTSISIEDKNQFMSVLNSDKDSLLSDLDNLPKPIYEKVKPNMDLDKVKSISLLLAVLYIVSSLFTYIGQLIMSRVTNNYGKMLRGNITNKIERLPLKYFDHNETGDVLSRMTNDVDTLSINLNQSLSNLLFNLMLFIGSIIMMFYTNPLMAITAIVSSIIGFMFMFLILGNLGYVAVCVVGAILCIKGKIDFGVIVAFMVYVRMFTNPLSQIAQGTSALQSIAAAGERVFEFLDEKEMPVEKVNHILKNNEAKGEITFEHVKFGYDKGKTIIKDFNASIKPGSKVAIVGPTGAGKTTMVNLLMKFYDIDSGDIKIDGISTKDLSRENIHDLFCMVLQDTWLFDGTIKENIKFNRENVTDEEIWEACKVVGVDHFIKTLPNGLDASVNDNDTISSGQKQLLTIARGMIEDAPFLILDEATSNVDTRTEELVQKAMDKLTEGRTSFIIAHRLSTIRNADLILVMNEGNIIETGNHDELIKKNGFYADLYNSQFEV